jgi:uncharacterized repeat protein (TIGR04076 family)
MKKVKITVVEVTDFNKIHESKDLGCSANIAPQCGKFKAGQVFETDMQSVPEGFCPHAFRDIAHHIIMLGEGGNYSWMNEKGKALVCCTDGFRPVIFRLERLDD